ncbi:MAG: hypothetical protein JWQ04_1580, partial [Pedosphaera sp.]|nr:hypothetical protein [Pedosphaera sp.]
AHHQAEDFMATIAREYEKKSGHKIQPILCQIVDGAARVSNLHPDSKNPNGVLSFSPGLARFKEGLPWV